MAVISKGFSTSYEIVQVASIKPGAAGSMENGQLYSASIKFISRNTEERMNKDVGLQEVEETIEFIIPCASNDEAALVGEAVRKLRDLKSPFYIFGGLPKKYDKNPYPFVRSYDSGSEFLNRVESITKIKPVINPNLPSVKLP
ncbi:hypothetical protein [Sulfuricurvum sp.]|uniref:hypothetical protein n=1 Tax=Sulfuricurvum sp. TaxID=2025608 RepID=UPI0035612EAE